MHFLLANRIKAAGVFELYDSWLAQGYSLMSFQVIHFVLANRIKAVVAFKLHDHWLADSHSLPTFQVMPFVLAIQILSDYENGARHGGDNG